MRVSLVRANRPFRQGCGDERGGSPDFPARRESGLLPDPGRAATLRTLAGEYFTDEVADLGSKDAAMQTRGVWIIELSELDSLSHIEVARIKAFMSRTTDRFRPPYGMRLVESPRQCVFASTVNHSTYPNSRN
jgi:predicted P-loop ATPase